MATSFLLRKSLTIPGALSLTGNTLGLTDKNYPYNLWQFTFIGPTQFFYYGHDIGTFTTVDTSKQVSGYPAGTTNNWAQNSSTALLKLPPGAIVEYAELVWGGATRTNGNNNVGPTNVDGSINNPVTLIAPDGRSFSVSPDPATNGIATVSHNPVQPFPGINAPYSGGDQVYYCRSQNVTNIVKQYGAGAYTCAGVPAEIGVFAPALSRCCGWDLVVMYRLSTLPVRNLNLFLGIDAVGTETVGGIQFVTGGVGQTVTPGELLGPRTINISGFITPETGSVTARLLLSGMQGDSFVQWGLNAALGLGDVVKFGPTASNLTTLSGPNNRANNFLANQINDSQGLLDTSGTFGNLNSNPDNAPLGEVKRGAWDITGLNASGLIGNLGRSAVVTIESKGDEYALHLLALQIDVNAPNLEMIKTVDKQNASTGDIITYTISIRNTGTTTATNVNFADKVPNDTTFQAGSVTVNGASTTNNPNPPGFKLPDIPPNQSVTVTFKVKIDRLPSPNPIPNKADLTYQYVQAPGEPTLNGTATSNTVNTLVDLAPQPSLQGIKSVSSTSGILGDEITYTVNIVNNGNVQLNNVTFVDTLPNGATFVPNSVFVNGENRPSTNPQNGIPIGTLAVGQTAQIVWRVTITSIPNPNPMPNVGYVGFNSQGVGGGTVPGGILTNTVVTNVVNATPGTQIVKEVDKTRAAVGERVTYTVTFTNTGNVQLQNVVFRDTIPNGATLVSNSTTINGVGVTPDDVQAGILIGTVPVGAVVKIQFAVTISTLPSPNPMPNTGNVIYQWRPAPGQSPLTGTTSSNVVNTDVFQGINPVLSLQKQVSLTAANIGDVLTYTIQIRNTGNVNLSNIVVRDTIPNGTTLVPGSTQLNFQPTGQDIQTGVIVGNLAPNGIAFVTFQVRVNEFPNPNPIPNTANAAFTSLNAAGVTVPGTTTSNQVNTSVNVPQPAGTIVKQVDKVQAVIGETVTYTVRITNTGGVNFNQATFVDTIPNGTSFIANTVSINGIQVPGLNPQTGIPLTTIPVGSTVVVQFSVRVDTIPNPNPFPNKADLLFKYTTNPSIPNGNNGSLTSNTVNTQVIVVNPNTLKSVDKATANVGDVLTYTITVNNTASIPLENVVVVDTVPNGTTFIPNSITVNGGSRGSTPEAGIIVGTIQPNQTATITYQVTITTTPNPNPIPNNASVIYNYRPDPAGASIPGSENTNTVTTQVGSQGTGSASLTKFVDKPTASVGDTLTYTLVIRNTGSLPLSNVNVQDTIPNGTSFNTGSVTINGTGSLTANPQSGINIGNLPVGGVTTVTFTVQVFTPPNPNPIPNNANTTFQYTPSGGTPQNGGANSNTVTTQVNQPGSASMSINKSVDKGTASVGETLTYTLVVRNTGSLPINNSNITDTIPNGTSFVPGTVTVNGVSQPSANPQTGISLGTLNAGEVRTITFQVAVTTVPNPNPTVNNATGTFQFTPPGGTPQNGGTNSNPVNTQVNPRPQGNLNLLKTVDKPTANIGETITYSILATNTGNSPIVSANVFDTIPNGTTFVPGSVTVAGASQATANPQTGIATGPLAVGQSVIITFQVRVTSTPNPNPIPNTANSSFIFLPSGGTPQTGTSTSNTVTTQVPTDPGSPGLNLFKFVDKPTANVGDVVTYTLVAQNTGSLLLSNVVVRDTVPNGTVFNQGSVNVNGVNNPTAAPQPNGIPFGNLAVGASSTATFTVTITTLPNPNPMVNQGVASYQFTPSGQPTQTGSTNSNPVTTQVNQPAGRPNIISSKQTDKSSAIVGDEITYTITISNTGTLAADNVIVTDQIPNGTTLVPGTVTVDGVTQPGGNPQTGVNIGTLAPGASKTVTFRVRITTIPNPNPISNVAVSNYQFTPPGQPTQTGSSTTPPVTTTVFTNTPIQSITKSVDKTFADVGDILTYTITVNNPSTLNVTNLIITDTIPNGTSFIANSVTLNGNQLIGSDPQNGVLVGNLPAGSSAILTYRVRITTLPNPNPIPNTANASYNFKPTPTSPDNSAQLTSNQVNTQVNTAIVTPSTPAGIFKTADKPYANIGDTITYTVSIRNSGNTTANNVIFRDTIPNGTTFIPNTLFVNGSPTTGNPSVGVGIGNIGPNGVVTVTFQVRVVTIPSPNPIPNSADISYTYNPNPNGPPTNGGSSSNVTTTTVSNGNIPPGEGIFKRVDKATAAIGDIITYTITLKNTGNVPVNNVILRDTIPNGTSFISNTVTIDSITQAGANPQNGINVGTINPLEVKIITFQVKVDTLPSPNPIPNAANVNYNYTVNPNNPPVNGSSNSNTVTTQVNKATINNNDGGLVKSVDKAFARVGDILTYTIKLTNTGNTAANNVVLTDTVPNDTTFVSGSVRVNGAASPASDPNSGVFVGTIAPNQTVFVTYQVKVDRLPTPNPIPNTANVRYSYTINPNSPNSETESNNSNQVTTQVNEANIENNDGGLVKSVDKTTASIGDVITYTITLRNTGNVAANNIVFRDTIPNGTSFISNSFTLNNTVISSANPQSGVNIGSLAPNQTAVVQFRVRVDTLPNPNPIPNQAQLTYNFLVDPTNGTTATESPVSNTVNTQVNQAIINPNNGDIFKSVDKTFASVGDIITYTIRVRNSGNTNALNVIFRDTIPNGTSFVDNSVLVNNISNSASNPQTGVPLGNISPNQTVIVQFKVKINTLPNPNPIPNTGNVTFSYIQDPATGSTVNSSATSNQVTTQVNYANINNADGGLTKLVDKAFAKVGDTLTYTINLNNNGNVNASNVVLVDAIPNGTTFVSNSVSVNGISQPGQNPQTGISVGTVPPNQTIPVTFQVVVITIPSPNPIPNKATVGYTYTVNPNNPNGMSAQNTSNTVTTQVNTAIISNPSAGLNKSVDKDFVEIGETITYTITLKNTGNVDALNVVFIDTIPNGTVFINNTFTLNGNTLNNANPQNGVAIGSLPVNGTSIITFKVRVVSTPNPNPIPNKGLVNYSYVVNSNTGEQASTQNASNTVLTTVNTAGFNPVVNGSITKSLDKTLASVGEEITYTITLRNGGNVTANNVNFFDTIPSGTSFVPGSVTINGAQTSASSPTNGIPLGNIPAGNSTIITFRVRVETIPTVNPIPNNSKVTYTFTKNPNLPNGESREDTSNTVFTKVNYANLSPANGNNLKSVDKPYADINEQITYTVAFKNTGNVDANNVIFQDTIPNGTTFITNSVVVNGTPRFGVNPQTGINLGTVSPNQVVTITFKVLTNTILNPNVIRNTGNLNYNFTVDPTKPATQVNTPTNPVDTVLNSAIINSESGGLVKSVDKTFATIGETLTYTIAVRNTGNVLAENVVLTDTVPTGTVFINNSVFIDGVSRPTFNPETGINLGAIPAGSGVNVRFQVRVTSIPSPNTIPNTASVNYNYVINPNTGVVTNKTNESNIVRTVINAAIINPSTGGLTKYVDKKFVDVNEVVTYTIVIKNTGNVVANNVIVKDTIPQGTSFVANSVTVNGQPQPNTNPQTGISLGNVNPNQAVTITFKVISTTVPNPNTINNNAIANYSYLTNPDDPNSVVPNNVLSNTVTHTVNTGVIDPTVGGFKKSVDKVFATVGETITYTIFAKNTGNVPVNNVIIKDTIPNGTSFISNSVSINGTNTPGANPITGINLDTLDPNEAATVVYQVLITTIPRPNPIPNVATVNYSYTKDPSVPNGVSNSASTNNVETQVNYAEISPNNGGLVKSVNKPYADVGDKLTYTITIKNTGNTAATNIVVKDTIPQGTSFVENSVTLNSNQILSANPQNGIPIGTLAPNATSILTFQVMVNTIPKVNPIPNNATVQYNFTKNPNTPNGESANSISNTVTTTISNGNVGPNDFVKSSDKKFVKLGDIITYSFKINNSGNVPINNVVVTDLIPPETNYIANSATLDGLTLSGANPSTGINVGTIQPNKFKTLSLQVKVVSIPATNPIINQGTLNYQYTVDPNKPPVNNMINSNTVPATVNTAIINNNSGGLVKEVDKEYAQLGDTLTYTIILKNTGNVSATNIVLRDTIPTGTEFIPSTVQINGVSRPTINPATGISILSIAPNETVTVKFLVKVTSIPPNGKVLNNSVVSYEYSVDPNKPNVTDTNTSNTVTTNINSVDFSGNNFTKIADPRFVKLGDTVTYTFVIKNSGSIAANNVVFTDTLPSSFSFIANSVVLNSIPLAGVNPQTGITLGTIAPNAVLTLVFKAKVNTIPSPNPFVNTGILNYQSLVDPNGRPVNNTIISNPQNVKVNTVNLNVMKSSNTNTAIVGETVTYTIKVTNLGNVTAENVVVSDQLSPDLEFIPGTVAVNSTTIANGNIISGVTLPNIAPNQTVTVTFNAKILRRPKDGTVSNIANVSYNYQVDPNKPNVQGNAPSNVNNVGVDVAKIVVNKTADVSKVVLGDTVTYTVTIENVGTVDANNVKFFDILGNELKFIPNTFTLNSIPINGVALDTGVTIGTLKPGEKAVISYKASVVKVCCNGIIDNKAFAQFEYKLSNNSATQTLTSNISKVEIKANSPNFKQLNIDTMVKIPDCIEGIEEINDVQASIEICNSYVVKTIIGTSSENKRLTGYKLVINGCIKQTIEYTANCATQKGYSFENLSKFSTFIILPEDYEQGTLFDVISNLEDIYHRIICPTDIFLNFVFTLDAIIRC